MKKRQRFLALFTGVGLAFTMSACAPKKEKEAVPSPEITEETNIPIPNSDIDGVQETVAPTPSETVEPTVEPIDYSKLREQKMAEYEEIKKQIEADGKYSIGWSGDTLLIYEQKSDFNPDYESFRKIIDLFNIKSICIGYYCGNLDMNELIGDKDISIVLVSPVYSPEKMNLRIAEKIKNSRVPVHYFNDSICDNVDSIVEILNAVGSKNGSLSLEVEDSQLICDLFDKMDSSCQFKDVRLTFKKSTSESFDFSKIKSEYLSITSDCNFSNITIAPTVKMLFIGDGVRVQDGEGNLLTKKASERISIATTSDSELTDCFVTLDYNSTVFDVPQGVNINYYVNYDAVETIINSGYIGIVSICGERTDIYISESEIRYRNIDLDIDETYPKSEFSIDLIYSSIKSHQEALEETQSKVK